MAKPKNTSKQSPSDKKFPSHPDDALFDSFYNAVKETMGALEASYGVTGVVQQIFGDEEDESVMRNRLREHQSWKLLCQLYDYAIHGQPQSGLAEMDLVLSASDVLKLATSEMQEPPHEWSEIVAMADGRFCLDEGSPMIPMSVSLLAGVDIRTIRNAMSAGDLVKLDAKDGSSLIENSSARHWLLGRRNFKPTVVGAQSHGLRLEDLRTPSQFGQFLREQRARIGADRPQGKLVVMHQSVGAEAILAVENGVFNLPLDCVLPLADFYQVDRRALIDCVMKVFFPKELRLLKGEEA
ncbi:MAG: hypothetical protein JWQ90_1499 [Hydrocarboniphaga sp.]|uniref:hypothetical protein n=1 Tax=Hydrocarboniphaga sp. TaxID=2033016 RepID=UPI00262F3E73|nr:hypothetical protein [Hydrocarboniphaga sp.]MDB5969049.1 hypothetical protein [Hydrocarboniphaga sp.]